LNDFRDQLENCLVLLRNGREAFSLDSFELLFGASKEQDAGQEIGREQFGRCKGKAAVRILA
jgi:hypothetical protein